MFRIFAILFVFCFPVHAQWAGQSNIINVINPQVQSIWGIVAVDDNFQSWSCAEWGHSVPCTNHWSVSRASVKYCPSVGNQLAQAASGTFCYTNAGLSNDGSVTNVALNSRDLTNASWTAAGLTTAKTATGVDGTVNGATLVTATGVASSCAATCTILQVVAGQTSSVSRVLSFYVQRVTGSGTVNITMDGGSTWTALTSSNCRDWNQVGTALITNDYVICTLTQTQTVSSIGLQFITLNDAINVDFSNFSTQVNAQNVFPTTGSSNGPAADVITASGAMLTYLTNSNNGGSIYGWVGGWFSTPVGTIDDFSNNAGTNQWVVQPASTTLKRSISTDVTTISATLGGGSSNVGAASKYATGWDAAGRSIVANAGTVATDTTHVFTGSTTTVTLGAHQKGVRYRRVIFNYSRWPDDVLKGLTANP